MPATTTRSLNYTGDDVARLRHGIDQIGFYALDGALAESTREQLLAEAQESFRGIPVTEHVDDRVRYRARIGTLGPIAMNFLQGGEAVRLIRSLFQARLSCSFGRSAYARYEAGDHLGPHLDEPERECSATMITYLRTDTAALAGGGAVPRLEVFGPKLTPGAAPILTIETTTGVVAFGRGAQVWHGRPRLLPGEAVVALTACYGSYGS